MTKAIILFSGGVDSTVILALALSRGLDCYTLSFDYGQKHIRELDSAAEIAAFYGVRNQVVKIDPAVFGKHAFGKSSLVESSIKAPQHRTLHEITNHAIPNTYVPARNTLFLSYALALCEIHEAQEIHYGANAVDNCGYPDCRPEYVHAFQQLCNWATKQAVEEMPPQIITPLIFMNKQEIFTLARSLQVPLELTWSCYQPTADLKPCGACDACILRSSHY
jgi:7-cyano-7-deazaguanine synthase